jgi:hypothetical protein
MEGCCNVVNGRDGFVVAKLGRGDVIGESELIKHPVIIHKYINIINIIGNGFLWRYSSGQRWG